MQVLITLTLSSKVTKRLPYRHKTSVHPTYQLIINTIEVFDIFSLLNESRKANMLQYALICDFANPNLIVKVY